MESIVINLAARYAASFGVQNAGLLLDSLVVEKKTKDYKFTEANPEQESSPSDYKLEYYLPNNIDFEEVTFEFSEKKVVFGRVLMEEGKYFAPPLALNFARKKMIISTTTSGSDNVIVERWGTMPWSIEGKGLLIDISGHQYPTKKIRQVVQLFEHNSIIKVTGNMFEDKKIDSIYIENINIDQVEGFADTMKIRFSAKSIKELSYNLVE